MTTQVQQSTWADDIRPSMRLWYLLIILPILAVIAFAVFQPILVVPRISLAPAYSFIDQNGARFTSEDMRGSLVLYSFTHADCVDPCVSTSASLAALRPALADVELDDIPLNFVTMVVDPAAAAPDVLQQLAATYQADADQWHFVSGDAAQLKNVIGAGFSTYYGPDANGKLIVDPVFVLVDGWGIVRATYRTPTLDAERLTRDLGLIIQEIRNSKGVNHYAYEAAHLFMCYPR